MIQKVLIANRGEIALRIIKTCQKLFIKTVAVFSEADKYSPHVNLADEAVYIGNSPAAESYLNIDSIIQTALKTKADAIHPGYGFLSENAAFAKKCEEIGLIFIGPTSEAIHLMGSKSQAKKIMQEHDVPLVPGYYGTNQDIDFLQDEANKIGFPLLIKASAGGGGKGMRIVRSEDQVKRAIEDAKREAYSSFGDDQVLLEKYFESVRHIEFQIFGDNYDNVIHLFERECSIQRRHQKIIEETPSPFLSDELRQKMGEDAIKAGKAIHYNNAGTVEFVVDEQGHYYFLEVNTRLQVEHPVTECITGLDLVQLQIEIADGKRIDEQLSYLIPKGHALEARLYAEDPENNFLPSIGKISLWKSPLQGRTDNGIISGNEVSAFYDPMLAKLIVHGENRSTAIQQMNYMLEKLTMLGLTTNQAYLAEIFKEKDFIEGNFNTHYIETHHQQLLENLKVNFEELKTSLLAVFLFQWKKREQQRRILSAIPLAWRNNFYQPQLEKYGLKDGSELLLKYRFLGENTFETEIIYSEEKKQKESAKEKVCLIGLSENEITFEIGNQRTHVYLSNEGSDYFVKQGSKQIYLKILSKLPEKEKEIVKGAYNSPMPGEVVKLFVKSGQQIQSGEALLVINSMKMENTIYAHSDGIIEDIFIEEKKLVKANEPLLKINEL